MFAQKTQSLHCCFKILLRLRFVLRSYSPRHFRVRSLGIHQPGLFVCPTQGNGTEKLFWQIGLNSRKQILRGFMANPIQLAEFWTGTRRAAGRKRFLNVLTKNVWNAGNREMSDEFNQAKHWGEKIQSRLIYTRSLGMSNMDHYNLGKTSKRKKTFQFGHCPNYPNPPQFGQLYRLFPADKNDVLRVWWKKYWWW